MCIEEPLGGESSSTIFLLAVESSWLLNLLRPYQNARCNSRSLLKVDQTHLILIGVRDARRRFIGNLSRLQDEGQFYGGRRYHSHKSITKRGGDSASSSSERPNFPPPAANGRVRGGLDGGGGEGLCSLSTCWGQGKALHPYLITTPNDKPDPSLPLS